VSGGADSVALLSLLRTRIDLKLHVVHLDHQLRGAESDGDARFVEEISHKWSLPCTLARRDEIESTLGHRPGNPSALYRAMRLELFRRVVRDHSLSGVVLAHHALDQAETVLHRLLRGGGFAGLAGMTPRAVIGGLVILRPLLNIDQTMLPAYLTKQGIPWRTDSSNASDKYSRNRLRRMLKRMPTLGQSLHDLGNACAHLRDWARGAAPELPERFDRALLARLPTILAHESARQWLIERGVPVDEVSTDAVQRVIEMSRDAASAPQMDFPGPVRVRRQGPVIFVNRGSK
jgi:tRNA(Ile)-lysidine synthase